MEPDKFVSATTLLLCFIAGFCDTVTFVAADELFSAHVTGNFIVFAYDIVKHTDPRGWQRLLSFPVFALTVMLGGHISKRYTDSYLLLIIESWLLVLAGILSGLLIAHGQAGGWQVQLVAMLTVMAMAIQNTFGKLNSKVTYGLTTVMTGNVTQVALDLVRIITNQTAAADACGSFKKQCYLIVGFLAGCITGALTAVVFGLVPILLPGLLLLFWCKKNSNVAENLI